jgi:hypothetical protein
LSSDRPRVGAVVTVQLHQRDGRQCAERLLRAVGRTVVNDDHGGFVASEGAEQLVSPVAGGDDDGDVARHGVRVTRPGVAESPSPRCGAMGPQPRTSDVETGRERVNSGAQRVADPMREIPNCVIPEEEQ